MPLKQRYFGAGRAPKDRTIPAFLKIRDILLQDALVSAWMARYRKGIDVAMPLRMLIETNPAIATLFRVAALAVEPESDRALLLRVLDEEEPDALSALGVVNARLAIAAAAGRSHLRAVIRADLPLPGAAH